MELEAATVTRSLLKTHSSNFFPCWPTDVLHILSIPTSTRHGSVAPWPRVQLGFGGVVAGVGLAWY